ncbi:MAG: tRNA (guanosine(37)-N1)-methyltransferase TrmD, partial [Thermodesulfobacteriota bacterium]|nr:tRNA (guanosine(37)-N1)-methyltransferase TrmD [Thermodesulfobacteriota bacterium]
MIAFDILSVFPEMFRSILGSSLIKRSIENGLVEVNLHNIRDYTRDRHRTTDDTPYGGGGGMVMKVEPVSSALKAIVPTGNKTLVILLSPQGETFKQKIAEELSQYSRIVLICGHYEGVDERIREHLIDREISTGDYVLSGGELPAMIVVDAVSRLVPGFVGNSESVLYDSFSTGLLEGPHYTRP